LVFVLTKIEKNKVMLVGFYTTKGHKEKAQRNLNDAVVPLSRSGCLKRNILRYYFHSAGQEIHRRQLSALSRPKRACGFASKRLLWNNPNVSGLPENKFRNSPKTGKIDRF